MDANALSSQFSAVCLSIGIYTNLVDETAKHLIASYSESQRDYHNLSHISHMLKGFNDSPEPQGYARDIMFLAIWFHDVVYDPIKGAPFNENESVATWEKFVEAAEPFLSLHKDSVSCLIKATIQHAIPPENEIPLILPVSVIAQFLDLDLAILGSPAEQYEVYAKQIRQEYQHVPDEAYRDGRAKVLRGFLARDKLFFGQGKEQEEVQARKNLELEIDKLSNLDKRDSGSSISI